MYNPSSPFHCDAEDAFVFTPQSEDQTTTYKVPPPPSASRFGDVLHDAMLDQDRGRGKCWSIDELSTRSRTPHAQQGLKSLRRAASPTASSPVAVERPPPPSPKPLQRIYYNQTSVPLSVPAYEWPLPWILALLGEKAPHWLHCRNNPDVWMRWEYPAQLQDGGRFQPTAPSPRPDGHWCHDELHGGWFFCPRMPARSPSPPPCTEDDAAVAVAIALYRAEEAELAKIFI